MKVRPASLYRNLAFLLAGLFLVYSFYSIVSYEDTHEAVHKRQKHLYLTVSKDRIGARFDTLAPKRILFWTPVFGEYKTDLLSDCKGLTDRCIYDSDRSLITKADAVLFHSQDITRDLPNSTVRRSAQRYVYMSMETPDNSGVARTLKLLPKNFFNWTSTYLLTSDSIFKYGSFWIRTKQAEERGFKITSFYVNPARLAKTKKGIFGMISNCHTTNRRELAIAELSKLMDVTIGGKCATDPAVAEICPKGNRCEDIYEQYPFFFALENSNCKDYVTEKYWERFHIASIPIVMRRSVYDSSNLPTKSFIALDDYKSPQEMADHLKYLETNSSAYAEYFAWRNGGWTVAPWNVAGYRNTWCRLCERLWEPNQTDSVVHDVYKWFKDESACEKDEFVQSWIAKTHL